MKKNIIVITTIIAISSHLNAMELQTTPCFFKNMPADIMNLIASFLTFDDVESEEEFIQREKSFSSYPPLKTEPIKYYTMIEEGVLEEVVTKEIQDPRTLTHEEFLKKKTIPLLWLKKHKNFENDYDLNFCVYSPNNSICTMLYITYPIETIEQQNLSIVNTKTNQELHNICLHRDDLTERLCKDKVYEHFAITSSGNIFAAIYSKPVNENIGWRSFIKIKNLCTQTKEYPIYPNDMLSHETIAFNKQETHLIVQGTKWNSIDNKYVPHHVIIPLTTTLNNSVPPKKTLAHYFTQKMICKKLMS